MLSIERWSAEAALPAIRIAGRRLDRRLRGGACGHGAAGQTTLAIEIGFTGAGLVDQARQEAILGSMQPAPRPRSGWRAGRLGPYFALYIRPFWPTMTVGDAEDVDGLRLDPVRAARRASRVGGWLDRRTPAPVLRLDPRIDVVDAAAAGAGLRPALLHRRPGRPRGPQRRSPNWNHEQWLVSHDDDRHDRGVARRNRQADPGPAQSVCRPSAGSHPAGPSGARR